MKEKNPREFSGPQAAFLDYFRMSGLDYRYEPVLRQAFMAGAVWSVGRLQHVGEKIAQTAIRQLPKPKASNRRADSTEESR